MIWEVKYLVRWNCCGVIEWDDGAHMEQHTVLDDPSYVAAPRSALIKAIEGWINRRDVWSDYATLEQCRKAWFPDLSV
jgi:hypothetical protein